MATTNDAGHQNPVQAPKATLELLKHLHRKSEEQERDFDLGTIPEDKFKAAVADKFIALDEDKCQFMYTLARAMGARKIVEAGTSYGVSTIYLALAASSNATDLGGEAHVIGTEHEEAKATKANEYFSQVGVKVDLRVGDLRETLKVDMPSVDMLLLDIWAPMALPALKLVQPHLRPGAVVLADNPLWAAEAYKELFEYVRKPGSGFQSLCLPYNKGLEMMVYYPPK